MEKEIDRDPIGLSLEKAPWHGTTDYCDIQTVVKRLVANCSWLMDDGNVLYTYIHLQQ